MDLSAILVYLPIGLTVGSLILAGYWYFVHPADPVQTRLKEINPRFVEERSTPPVSKVIVERVAKPIVELLPSSPRKVRRLRRRLIQAGFMHEHAGTFYRLITLFSTI